MYQFSRGPGSLVVGPCAPANCTRWECAYVEVVSTPGTLKTRTPKTPGKIRARSRYRRLSISLTFLHAPYTFRSMKKGEYPSNQQKPG